MTRMICLRASSDCKRLTKHENTGLGWVIAASRSVCDTPKKTLILASEGFKRASETKASMRSPRYTTRLADLPTVRA